MHVGKPLAKLSRVVAVAAILLTAGVPGVGAQETDGMGMVNAVEMGKDGSIGQLTTRPLPRDAFGYDRVDGQPKKDAMEPRPPSRIHPRLEEMVNFGDPSQRVRILVNLQDNVAMPRLPDLPAGETRDSQVAAELSKRQDAIVDDLLRRRMDSQAGLIRTFAERHKMQVTEQFWLVNAFAAEAPLGAVKELLASKEVLYLQPEEGGEKPPVDGNPNNDTIDGRALILSDPYFNQPGMTGGYIGLLDTGVRTTHTMFAWPNDHIDFLRDCVNGGATCNNTAAPGFNTDDDCWNHGTSTAGIVTGNANLGANWRGVTAVTLDSWKVYPNGCGGLNATAVLRGFQRGLLVFDRIFIAEMQAWESENGTIATAADNAFAAGAVVIAANGNNGPGAATVNSPAIAHKVIGIGAYNVQTLATPGYQSRGPATDGRYKPDLQAPTDTETASSAAWNATQSFGGTSGATPYGGAVAALTRNWMLKFGTSAPGAVYARMILSGQNPWPYDNTQGAGHIEMPTCSTSYWGTVTINATGSIVDIPIGVPAGRTGLQAALWWPEGVAEAHDDIDVHIMDPANVQRAMGFSSVSVFERTEYMAPLATGTWKVRVKGWSVPSGPQTVYWSARVVGC
jgi:serine protease AprX